VQQLDNVYLYNVDHLETIVRENLRLREQELARCQVIVAERSRSLMTRFAPPPVPDGLAAPKAEWAYGETSLCHG
jgi:hypothetical protein